MASTLTNPFDEEDESLAGSSYFAAQGTTQPQWEQERQDAWTTQGGTGTAPAPTGFDLNQSSDYGGTGGSAYGGTSQFDASGGGQAAGGGDYWGANASGGSQYADYANQQPAYDWGSYAGTSSTAGTKEPSAFAPTDTSGGFATPDGQTTAQTPEQEAIAKDQMARQLYTELKAAGHDVKWEGDQLMVDGRAYVMGSGAAGAQTLQAQSTMGPQATQTAAGPAALAGTQMTATPTATTTATGTAGGAAAGTQAAPTNTRLGGTAGGSFLNMAEGFDINKLNAPGVGDHDTSKYQFLSLAQHIDPRDPNGLQKIVDQAKAAGLNWQFDGKDKIDFGDGYGPIDVLTNATAGQGGDTWWWGAGAGGAEAGGMGGAGAGMAAGGVPGAGTEGAAGVDLQGAFTNLQSLVGPNASREEMEAAISSAFKGVPGFEEAYKESVKINGQWYDLVGNYGGDNPTWQLMPKNDGAAGGAAGVAGAAGGSPLAAGAQGAAGVHLGPSDPGFWIQLPGGGQVPYDHPLAVGQPGAYQPGGGTTPGGPATPASTQGIPGIPGTSSTAYVPGEVPDVEGVPGYEDMLARMGNFQPGQITSDYQFGGFNNLPRGGDYQFGGYNLPTGGDYQFGGYGMEGLEQPAEDLYKRIMENPESLGPREIAMMQGASREEASQMAQLENEQMRAGGYAAGIQGSPWMAAEEGRTNRARDEAIIGANRNIDIEAAKTNMGDRRAAAALGSDYLTARTGRGDTAEARKLSAADFAERRRAARFGEQDTAEGRKLSAAEFKEKQRTSRWTEQVKAEEFRLSAAEAATKAQQSTEDNRFRAEAMKSDNVAKAASHSIQQAAAIHDRVKLQETIKQEATRLGLAEDELLTQWLTAQMDDLTKRYGIDIQAALAKEGIQVDREKLAQAGSEFKMDLAFRYAALAQEGELGKLNIGLGYGQLGASMTEEDNEMYRWMMGGGGGG